MVVLLDAGAATGAACAAAGADVDAGAVAGDATVGVLSPPEDAELSVLAFFPLKSVAYHPVPLS